MKVSLMSGQRVKICANEFVQTNIAARITDISENGRNILLQMDSPLAISGTIYTHAIASPRLATDSLNSLLKNQVIGCAVTWLPKEQMNPTNIFDLTWWRGGAATITDLMLD